MIMKNIQTESNEYSRIFTRILHAAQNHWTEIERNPEAKTARGTLQNGDELIIAVLSLDNADKHLTLTVRQPVNKELDMPTMRQVLRYQNHHRNHAFLAVDDECHIASVWSESLVCEDRTSMAVDCVFKSTSKLLRDNELKEILN